MIVIKNLTKKFDTLVAVKDLNLNIEPGKIFGFLGPNGAGKTTTIKILMGLLFPTEGRTFINNIEVSIENSYEIKRMVGYVPEEPILYDKLTGFEFVNFICTMYEMDEKEIIEKIDYYFQLFDLKDHSNRFIETFSKGTKRKLSITSALIHDPEILILDEPTEGLDPRMIHRLKNLLIENKKKGKTIFLSTHILQIAEELCDEVGILDNGNLLFAGTIEELRNLEKMPDANLEKLFLQLTDEK